VTDYVPSARPGGRAPHVNFERDGQQVSTINVIGNGFALLTASSGQAWIAAAKGLNGSLPLKALAIEDDSFATAYELEKSGAVLVRPDGHVGWRSRAATGDPSRTLRDALATIMGRNS
jgi:putative polyketide hydroxylase